jgi:hypothetical protein
VHLKFSQKFHFQSRDAKRVKIFAGMRRDFVREKSIFVFKVFQSHQNIASREQRKKIKKFTINYSLIEHKRWILQQEEFKILGFMAEVSLVALLTVIILFKYPISSHFINFFRVHIYKFLYVCMISILRMCERKKNESESEIMNHSNLNAYFSSRHSPIIHPTSASYCASCLLGEFIRYLIIILYKSSETNGRTNENEKKEFSPSI